MIKHVLTFYAQHIYPYSTSIYIGLDSAYLQSVFGTVLFLPEFTKHPTGNSSSGACCSDRVQPVTKKDQTSLCKPETAGKYH